MENKPGYKTTEFWVTFVTTIATLLNQAGILGSLVLPIESIGVVAAMLAPYVIGRSVIKKNEAAAK